MVPSFSMFIIFFDNSSGSDGFVVASGSLFPRFCGVLAIVASGLPVAPSGRFSTFASGINSDSFSAFGCASDPPADCTPCGGVTTAGEVVSFGAGAFVVSAAAFDSVSESVTSLGCRGLTGVVGRGEGGAGFAMSVAGGAEGAALTVVRDA